MTTAEVLEQLKGLGQESIKKVLLKHGIKEPLYGVKVEELKKIQKKVKKDHLLSLGLYDSGIYDAMYLAGLVADPEKMSEAELEKWVRQANAPALFEYTVPWVTSESHHGTELALKWIDSGDEGIASAGWATMGSIVAITEDAELDMPLLRQLLARVAGQIHGNKNRVKYAMNSFVIAVCCYVKELNALAKETAQKVGKVAVDMGDTACKIPAALEYIAKVEDRNTVGKKRKTAAC